MKTTRFLVALLAFGLGRLHAESAINLPDPYTDPFTTNVQDQTLGWAFQVDAPITITALGLLDLEQDGLLFDHEIGLWQEGDTNPLVTALIPSGDATSALGYFRYVDTPEFTLDAGTVYLIGAYYSGMLSNPFQRDYVNNIEEGFSGVFGPGITFLGARTSSQGIAGLAYPDEDTYTADAPFLGPNFLYRAATPTAVPEGSAGLLMPLGLLALAAMRRRQERVA